MAIATPESYADMIDRAKAGGYAIPAINVTSSQTLSAALQGFTEAESDGIVQVSNGGAAYWSGSSRADRVKGSLAMSAYACCPGQPLGFGTTLEVTSREVYTDGNLTVIAVSKTFGYALADTIYTNHQLRLIVDLLRKIRIEKGMPFAQQGIGLEEKHRFLHTKIGSLSIRTGSNGKDVRTSHFADMRTIVHADSNYLHRSKASESPYYKKGQRRIVQPSET